jgi:hypothetical protein
MHYEHLAILKKKFDPTTCYAEFEHYAFIMGDGIRAHRRKPSSGTGANYGSRPTPRIMPLNLRSFLSGSKMASTFKLTMHGS